MLVVVLHDQRPVEKSLLTLGLRDLMSIPILCSIAIVPLKADALCQSLLWGEHDNCILPSYTQASKSLGGDTLRHVGALGWTRQRSRNRGITRPTRRINHIYLKPPLPYVCLAVVTSSGAPPRRRRSRRLAFPPPRLTMLHNRPTPVRQVLRTNRTCTSGCAVVANRCL